METPLEYMLVNSFKDEALAYIHTHPKEYTELIQLVLANKKGYSWRAAWLLFCTMDKNDKRVQKYVPQIIEILSEKKYEQARELLKIVQLMDLSEEQEGKVFDICVTLWENISNQSSVRFSALKLLLQIAKKHPELSQEIKFLLEPHYMDSLSHGIKKSIYNILPGLT